jgi:hypothetical protein
MCKKEGCAIIANFAQKGQDKGQYCDQHKTSGMVNVVAKYCDECDTRATFGYKWQAPTKCSLHRSIDMKNVVDKRCLTPSCETRSSSSHKGYCARCFVYLFPEETSAKMYRIKEKHVEDFIKELYPDVVCNMKVNGGCSMYRPDFFIDVLTHSIIIEVDENQHASYDEICENKRMMTLFEDLGSRPIVLIRFNPDKYIKDGKVVPSCFSYHKRFNMPIVVNKANWNDRLKSLHEVIQKSIENVPNREVTLTRLYYDS